jgi:hypothetical protein
MPGQISTVRGESMVADPVDVYNGEGVNYWESEEQREADIGDMWDRFRFKSRHISNYAVERILELGRKEVPAYKIAEALGIGESTVRRRLKKANIKPISKPKAKPESFKGMANPTWKSAGTKEVIQSPTKLNLDREVNYLKSRRLTQLTIAAITKEILHSPGLERKEVLPTIERRLGLEQRSLFKISQGGTTFLAKEAAVYIFGERYGIEPEIIFPWLRKPIGKVSNSERVFKKSMAILEEASQTSRGNSNYVYLTDILDPLFGPEYQRRPKTLTALVELYNADLAPNLEDRGNSKTRVNNKDIDELVKRIIMSGYLYSDELILPADLPNAIATHPADLPFTHNRPGARFTSDPDKATKNSYTLVKDILDTFRYDGESLLSGFKEDMVDSVQLKAMGRVSKSSRYLDKGTPMVSRDALVDACIGELKKDSPLNKKGATRYLECRLEEISITDAADSTMDEILSMSMPLRFGDKKFYSLRRLGEALERFVGGYYGDESISNEGKFDHHLTS